MSASDNAALARRMYDLFSHGKVDDALEYATDDVELILYPFGQTFHGKEGFRAFMTGFTDAFPDISITVTNQVADETQVATEFTATGTHGGVLRTPAGDIPPTRRTVEFVVCEVWTVRDGLLASLRNYQDAASLMRQLGVA